MTRRRDVIAALLLIGGGAACKQARDEVHLIPSGYVGAVTISYNDPAGQPLPVQDGTITYVIPPDGVLRIRDAAPWKDGLHRVRYAYTDGKAQTQLTVVQFGSSSLGVFGSTDGMQVVQVNGQHVGVTAKSYFVGVPSSRPSWAPLRDESIQRAALALATAGTK
jgi:hypothetical protein